MSRADLRQCPVCLTYYVHSVGKCICHFPKKGESMRLDDLVEQAHRTAYEKGWWDTVKSPLEIHMLIVSEVAEATEACRIDQPAMFIKDGKPEGEAIELADAVIRIADWFGRNGWSLEDAIKVKMDYNLTRPYRHGDKKY